MQTFLPALSCPVQRGALRSSVRSFLHRMIICLEEEVLPFIPAASEHLLKDCEAKDLQEFIPLISQMTAKFKVGGARGAPGPATRSPHPPPPLSPRQRQVSPFLQQVFMPLVLAIFEVLARPADDNDQAAALDKQMLRRSYFTFIQTVTGSGMNEVLANQGELPKAEWGGGGWDPGRLKVRVCVRARRSRECRAGGLHHHPGRRGHPRPRRPEDLLHHSGQAGGAVG